MGLTLTFDLAKQREERRKQAETRNMQSILSRAYGSEEQRIPGQDELTHNPHGVTEPDTIIPGYGMLGGEFGEPHSPEAVQGMQTFLATQHEGFLEPMMRNVTSMANQRQAGIDAMEREKYMSPLDKARKAQAEAATEASLAQANYSRWQLENAGPAKAMELVGKWNPELYRQTRPHMEAVGQHGALHDFFENRKTENGLVDLEKLGSVDDNVLTNMALKLIKPYEQVTEGEYGLVAAGMGPLQNAINTAVNIISRGGELDKMTRARLIDLMNNFGTNAARTINLRTEPVMNAIAQFAPDSGLTLDHLIGELQPFKPLQYVPFTGEDGNQYGGEGDWERITN